MEYDMQTEASHETEPQIIDVFVLIDMDRMLLDSNEKVRLQCELLTKHGVPRDEADEAVRLILGHTGTSLAEEGFLRGLFGDEIMDKVNADMLELATNDDETKARLFYGNAGQRLITTLKEQGYNYGIFTHGEEENQLRKIALVRAAMDETEETLPAMVTDQHEKALHAGTWVDQAGLIDIPVDLTGGKPYKAMWVVIIDDKRKNLIAGKHQCIVGIYVNNHGDSEDGQRALAKIDAELEAGASILELAQHFSA